MSKYECITVCVTVLAVSLVLSVIAITVPIRDSLKDLAQSLSQPGSPTRVEIDHMTITNGDGVSFEITGFDAMASSRLIDIITGLALADGQ